MKRLTPEAMDAALVAYLVQFSVATHVDPIAFADWIRANLNDLRGRFEQCEEPTDTDRRVENTQGIWLRFQFKARMVSV